MSKETGAHKEGDNTIVVTDLDKFSKHLDNKAKSWKNNGGMKFIVSSTTLFKNLQLIAGVIRTDSVLPILEDFLFELRDAKLTLLATDLETSISTQIAVETKDNGLIAIPAKLLMDTLKSMPEQPITFKTDGKTFAVEIVTETGNFKLSGADANDFPKTPQPEDVNDFSIDAVALSNAISKTLIAVSNDELRPAMTGVLFELGEDGINFVATDAHKLICLTRTDVRFRSRSEFIIPKKALTLLKKTLAASDIAVTVSYNKSNAFFQFGETKMICRLIDANFPDYRAVIPQSNPNKLSISRLEFHNALSRVAFYSNKTTYQAVFSPAPTLLEITAQDFDFQSEAKERVTCDYDGKEMEFAFNSKYLLEMLSTLDSGDVVIELSEPTRAGVLVPAAQNDNEKLLMLLMPVQINE